MRPFGLSWLGKSYADLHQLDDAWRSVNEAKDLIERTEDRWAEADVHRIAGEIALSSPQPDAAKAEVHFERALSVARQQEAKSWELRAAMSAAVAQSGEASASSRTARSGLRLVHRGLRYARLERGQGAIGQASIGIVSRDPPIS
jgi:predicted ATPase